MIKPDYYWRSKKEWWRYDKNLNPVLTKDAPKEARESFENYKKQMRSISHN